ncbi:MAG TPA: D-alanine--D-alanine ligase [Bacillota bacterium]|nr:D-alanine--D-alanine ligase [Bacillota bacterium]
MTPPMLRVALLYNLRRGKPTAETLDAEYDPPATVDALEASLRAGGTSVTRIEADAACAERLRAEAPDVVFNVAEGLRGASREAHVPAICEMLGIPCTGSGVLAQAVCQDKPFALRVLRDAGIPTAQFWEVEVGSPPPAAELPLFVKPARQGSSMGVTEGSLCRTADELAARVWEIHEQFGEPALVESFLPGREFTVGILDRPLRALPIREIMFGELPAGYPPVYSYKFKKEWDDARFFTCPPDVPPQMDRRLVDLALGAFRALRCVDVARVDLRCDALGRPAVMECNPLPGLAPDFSDLPCMATVGGLSYADLVLSILDAACRRSGLNWRRP